MNTSTVSDFHEFTFWKNNKADEEYQLKAREIILRFDVWLDLQPSDWLTHYGCYEAIRTFITSDSGLKSSFLEKQFPEFRQLLRPVFDARY